MAGLSQGAHGGWRTFLYYGQRSYSPGLGTDGWDVKELLGHESLETLRHYARLTITDLKETHRRCHPRERDKRHI